MFCSLKEFVYAVKDSYALRVTILKETTRLLTLSDIQKFLDMGEVHTANGDMTEKIILKFVGEAGKFMVSIRPVRVMPLKH